MTTNIKIITPKGELIYKSQQQLNIIFNRIVDDSSNIESRYGDFSYEFTLPDVKENAKIFGHIYQHGAKKIFKKNQNIPCKIYNNNSLILDGIINVSSIGREGYRCKFFSNFTVFIDKIQEKKLNELEFPLQDWNYESTIIAHINAQYKNSDETFFQFPLSYYSTTYCEHSIYNGKLDDKTISFRADNARQNHYYLFNSVDTNKFNRHYYHQFPPALYLKSIVEQIVEEAGFRINGSFFDDENIKKIIYLYAGEEDIYDKATGVYSGSESLRIQYGKFLPDMRQSEFLQSVINYFNLYFIVDGNTITFETYNNLFNSTANPVDMTDKINASTVEFNYLSNNNPSIRFEAANNRNILGDSKVMSMKSNNATSTTYTSTDGIHYNSIFNKIGSDAEIRLKFAEPNTVRRLIWNDVDVNGNAQAATTHTFFQPCLSKQTPTDNNSKPFNKDIADTHVFNNESTVSYRGTGALMYYYGISTSNFENKANKGVIGNYMYVNMYVAGVINRVKIPVVSPWQLMDYRNNINTYLDNLTAVKLSDKETAVVSYLQSLWQILGNTFGVGDKATAFSLVFDEDSDFHETLYSKFHQNKYERWQNSEVLTADCRLSAYDWQQLKINTPILYNRELYHLMAIESYNVVEQSAVIKLIKTQ